MSSSTNPIPTPLSHKRTASDAALDSHIPQRPVGTSDGQHKSVQDRAAPPIKRTRFAEAEGEGSATASVVAHREQTQAIILVAEPMGTPTGGNSKNNRARKPRPPTIRPEDLPPSRRHPGLPEYEPYPRPIVPLSHFRAQHITVPQHKQPRSHTNWSPYHQGPNIPYFPKATGLRAPPGVPMKKGVVDPPPVEGRRKSRDLYQVGNTYKAWMAPPNLSLSTFEAYARDAMRAEIPSMPEQALVPEAEIIRPAGWLSPAQRCTDDILENIFDHLYLIVLANPLPCVPIKGRDPWAPTLANDRLTNGETKAYKTAIMRKSLYDYGLVCKSWWSGTQKGWNEVVIIGERDAERALKRIDRWIPVQSTRHLSLTLQMTLPCIHRLLRSLAHAVHRCLEKTVTVPILGLEPDPNEPAPEKPARIPIPMRRLTILHSFEPEDLGKVHLHELEQILAMFAPVEFEMEFFGGAAVIEKKSLDTVARALRFPWGYFGVKDKFRVVMDQDDEMGLVNAAEGTAGTAYIERQTETPQARVDREKLERKNRKVGEMKPRPGGEVLVAEVDTILEVQKKKAAEEAAAKKKEKRKSKKERRALELGAMIEERDLDLAAKPRKKKKNGENRSEEEPPVNAGVTSGNTPRNKATGDRQQPVPTSLAKSSSAPAVPLNTATSRAIPQSTPSVNGTSAPRTGKASTTSGPQPSASSNAPTGPRQKPNKTLPLSNPGRNKRKRDEEIREEAEVNDGEETDSDSDSDTSNYVEYDQFASEGPNENSMVAIDLTNVKNADPWLLADNEFDPSKNPDDRVAAYIYAIERRNAHLTDPVLEGLHPDERQRREIWAGLFGDNADLEREFTSADKKWLKTADQDRMPRGWIPPIGWRMNNPTGAQLLGRALTAWQDCLEKLSVRAHWINIYHQIKQCSKKGKLTQFDYHFIPLPAKTVSRKVMRRRPHRSPNPPLGGLKSLDNILMWDFRERPEKWYRKFMRKRAKEHGEEWDEPPAVRKLKWFAHVPFDLWMQQKDRQQFKGKGRGKPWTATSETVVLDAMKKVLLEEGAKWDPPQCAEDDEWTNQQYFDEMVYFVINTTTRTTRLKYAILHPVKANHLFNITRGEKLTPEWLAHHVATARVKIEQEKMKWADREERWFNDPEAEKDRWKWIEKNMERYLIAIDEKGRREVMHKLRKKYGAKKLWERCNWDLVHPNYPGVTIQVEAKEP